VKRIGVVVPTLFSRSDYLRQSLEAIRKAGDAHVILMGPNVEANSKDYKGLFDELLEEPNTGTLSEKLSFALNSFPENIDLITWIGDDDLLAPASIEFLEKEFRNDEDLSLIYGVCNYIDSNDNNIGQNKSGPWALGLAKLGPFLAPQPGSLFRRRTFEAIGGLDSSLELAFDLDLFLGLNKHGKTKYTNKNLASFRWHEDSLSVGQRKKSVKEASIVRAKHSSSRLRPLLTITNPLVEIATYLAGAFVTWRLKTKTTR
jgi:hypothetical protein